MLIFLHLPRTGGTTIITVLEPVLRPAINIEAADDLQVLLELSNSKRCKLRFAYGHMPYGLHALVNVTCNYFVFLRDPVDRVLSSYHYIRQTPEHHWYGKVGGMTVG